MNTDTAYHRACSELNGQVTPAELLDIAMSMAAMAIDQLPIEAGAWGLANAEATILAKLDAVIKGGVAAPVPAVGLEGINHCDRTEPMMTDALRQKLKLVN
jgi:hypothetical protein